MTEPTITQGTSTDLLEHHGAAADFVLAHDDTCQLARRPGMSPDSDSPITQGALNRLEGHLVERIEAVEKHVTELMSAEVSKIDQRFDLVAEAVKKAEAANEKRFEGLNELRGAMEDQQRTLMPRLEAEQRMKAAEAAIGELKRKDDIRGGQVRGARDSWGFVAGAVGILIALLTLALRFIGTPPK